MATFVRRGNINCAFVKTAAELGAISKSERVKGKKWTPSLTFRIKGFTPPNLSHRGDLGEDVGKIL